MLVAAHVLQGIIYEESRKTINKYERDIGSQILILATSIPFSVEYRFDPWPQSKHV